MDTLSDVLRAVRLSGAIFFEIRASEPWVAETPAGPSIVANFFPDAQHLIPYHVIARGACWAGLLDEPPILLSEGDVIVFPHGDSHVMSSAPGMRNAPDMALYQRRAADAQLPFELSLGSAETRTAHVFCGYLGCDARPFNPLLSTLPRMFRVSDDASGTIGTLARFAAAETNEPRPGSVAVLGRLSELLFFDVVRRYVETLPSDQTGWLAGLRDCFVGRALAALHRSPAHCWTLELLAREVGLSRSALAERFQHLVGLPVMQYLTNWRMQLASKLLMSGSDGMAAIAEHVGYDSEAAFSRAFKKIVGMPPSQWRTRGRTV